MPRRTAAAAAQPWHPAGLRDAGVTSAQFRALAALTPAARQAIADLIKHTARTEGTK